MIIPILANHDWNETPIGLLRIVNDGVFFHFTKGVSREDLFNIFGNVGYIVLESTTENDEIKIKYGRIVEWSYG